MKLILLCLFALVPTLSFAQGGPPMVTDDPGTPGDGHWEINIASLLSANVTRDLIQAPYFDINYGLGDRLQLKVETGWTFVSGQEVNPKNGADIVLTGVKYRFLDESKNGVSVSTYPQFQFHPTYAPHDPELAQSGSQWLLPIELVKNVGNVAVNPEIGFLFATAISNQILYGVVFAYEASKPLEPLIEIHGNTLLDGTGTELLLNAGGRYTVTNHLNLLFAAGHTVTHLVDSTTELDAYFGVQLEL